MLPASPLIYGAEARINGDLLDSSRNEGASALRRGEMAKHKVWELDGALLDAAVAKAEGLDVREVWDACWILREPGRGLTPFGPSSDWAEGGPIIERERITIDTYCNDLGPAMRADWHAAVALYGVVGVNYEAAPLARPKFWHGETPLVAAMRAYVASKLGDEVDLPGNTA
jgi:hypothetical protein